MSYFIFLTLQYCTNSFVQHTLSPSGSGVNLWSIDLLALDYLLASLKQGIDEQLVQAGCGPFLLIICSIHSFLFLLFSYVGLVESNMNFQLESLYIYSVLGNMLWSLFTLIQGPTNLFLKNSTYCTHC